MKYVLFNPKNQTYGYINSLNRLEFVGSLRTATILPSADLWKARIEKLFNAGMDVDGWEIINVGRC